VLKSQYPENDNYLSMMKLTALDLYVFYAYYLVILINVVLYAFSEKINHKVRRIKIYIF
jgi:hypothetical protein